MKSSAFHGRDFTEVTCGTGFAGEPDGPAEHILGNYLNLAVPGSPVGPLAPILAAEVQPALPGEDGEAH